MELQEKLLLVDELLNFINNKERAWQIAFLAQDLSNKLKRLVALTLTSPP
jgi:hypothetical protein